MRRPKSRCLYVVLALSLVAPGAWAQPDPEREREGQAEAPPPKAPLAESLTGDAKQAYDAARILYEDGDWAGAKLKFERAYDLSKDPRLLWNMAAADKNLRRYASVLALLERYLAEGGDYITADDRHDADQVIRTVRAFVADLTLTVNEPGAEIQVDGQKVATSPMSEPVRIDMGQRRIVVEKPGFKRYEKTHRLPGGEAVTIEVALVAESKQGTLRVIAPEDATIRIDGKRVGSGHWQGKLASGRHTLSVTAPGMRPYQTDVVVSDGQLVTERVQLSPEAGADPRRDESGPPWAWIAAGAAVAIGVGVGAYFLFRDDSEATPANTVQGTIPPHSIQLGFW